MKHFGLTAIASIVLVGCAAGTSEVQRMQAEGYDPMYITAYDDGCHSGRASAGAMLEHITKQIDQYDSASKYRQGWDDGFRVCEGRERAFQHRIENSVRASNERRNREDDLDRVARDAARDALKGADLEALRALK